MTRFRPWVLILMTIAAITLAIVKTPSNDSSQVLPDTEQTPTPQYQTQETFSQNGRFLVAITIPKPLTDLNAPLTASIKLTDANGNIKKPLRIAISGGMREHGHGLPSHPKVTEFQNNEWHITGLEFSMNGQWQLNIELLDEQGWDWVQFDLLVGITQSGMKSSSFSTQEIRLLDTLNIRHYQPHPDPTNPISQNPKAIETGRRLFFDRQLSGSKNLSCASCHQPNRAFTDGLTLGFGENQLNHNTPTLLGVSQQRWFYHDGRKDSLWSQALGPMEARDEMASTRTEILRYFFTQEDYRDTYKALFGPSPDIAALPNNASPKGHEIERSAWKKIPVKLKRQYNMAFANIGRLIAAYETQLIPTPSRFDLYLDEIQSSGLSNQLNQEEILGLKLFISSKFRCIDCHNGPTFSNGQFHNIGTRRESDLGRQAGGLAVLHDEFNCLGRYSTVNRDQCKKLKHIQKIESSFQSASSFKVPTLRNLPQTGPYFHDGRKKSLKGVVEHYRNPPKPPNTHELLEINMTDKEAKALVSFLQALNSKPRTHTHSQSSQ